MALITELLGLKRDPRTEEEMGVAYNLLCERSRHDFALFRRAINGSAFIDGWFPREIAQAFQDFYTEYKAGHTPLLIISTPPQHGKSVAVIDFMAWIVGKEPENAHIFASFSDRLGVRANKGVKRILSSKIYSDIFPETKLSTRRGDERGYANNDNFFEFPQHNGSFKNVTCGGAITGQSITGIGFIDDPIKGRQESNSQTKRESIADWYADDWGTRFAEGAAQVIIMTRWHISDLVGTIIKSEEGKHATYIEFPAIATKDEAHRKEGDALFPEFKSMKFLHRQKAKMTESSWESLYQCHPIIAGGNLFKYDWMRFTTKPPKFDYTFIVADTAQKDKEQNDYTVFQAWGYHDGKIYLYDMTRGKWKAPEMKRRFKAFYQKHDNLAVDNHMMMRRAYIEDKSSGSSLIQEIEQDHRIKAIQRNTDKVMRANDSLIFFEQGQVWFVEGIPFLTELTDELLAFPNAVHDDTVDPLMDATEIALNVGRFNLDALVGA